MIIIRGVLRRSISLEELLEIPPAWRPFWYRWEKILEDDPEIPDNNLVRTEIEATTPIDVREISTEKKNKLKAIIYGELRNEKTLL